jgi:predicted P-loop ATPase
MVALRQAPAWAGVLGYNAFSLETMLLAPPPWEQAQAGWATRAWTSHDDLLAANWLQHEDIAVTVRVAQQAVEAVARDASFHPVIDYLESLRYDNRPRLNDWLTTCLGAPWTTYTEEVGRVILISAIARVYQPGCKVDTVPILEGPQGAKKSTAVRTMFDPWFTDELADFGSKDAAMQTRGVWCLEVSELDAMSRGEASRIKAFISRTTDRFRPPYGSRLIVSPRSCVFVGTTNGEAYLKDETGGRRFLPIPVGKINVERLCAERDQLWAEALIAYKAGMPWWITDRKAEAVAAKHQRDRYIDDPWDSAIQTYIGNRTSVTVDEILHDAIHLEIGRCGQAEQNRVARSLRSLGWQRKQVRTGGKRTWCYVKPARDSADDADELEEIENVTSLRVVTGKNR